jgi:hypothetical protein
MRVGSPPAVVWQSSMWCGGLQQVILHNVYRQAPRGTHSQRTAGPCLDINLWRRGVVVPYRRERNACTDAMCSGQVHEHYNSVVGCHLTVPLESPVTGAPGAEGPGGAQQGCGSGS